MKKVTINGTVTLHHRCIYRGYLQIACCDLTRAAHPCLWMITWDPTEPVATRPLAIQKDGTWYCYGLDITKNVWELFGPSGYIRTAYDYTPYGGVTEDGDVTQPVQWSSEVYDEELALVYYNYRHYNPMDGRWINRDPIAEEGGWNLYVFLSNSPFYKYDYVGWWERIDVWSRIKSKYQGKICAQKDDTWTSLYKEVAGSSDQAPSEMTEAGKEYEVRDLLKALETQLRNNIAAATTALIAPFPARNERPYFDPSWKSNELNRFFVGGRGPLECYHATVAVVSKGVISTLGEKTFDALFTAQSFTKPKGAYLEAVKVDSVVAMQKGDWGYIANDLRYNEFAGNLQGENIIKLDGGKLWGHGIPTPATEESIKKLLIGDAKRQGIPDPVVSFRPEYNYFPAVAKIAQAVFDYKKKEKLL